MAEEKEGWTFFLLFICIEVTLGTIIPIGFFYGVVNAPAEFIRQFANDSMLSHHNVIISDSHLTLMMATFVSIFPIGGMIGSIFASACNAAQGRRGSLISSAILFVVAGIFLLFSRSANTVVLLLLGRFIGGIASGLSLTTQPMYLVELAPSELSGSVGVFTCIGITGGIVLGQIFSFDYVWGSDAQWHVAQAGYLIFVAIGMAPICLIPESPSHLISRGKAEEGKEALKRLRHKPERVEQELAEIEAAAKSTEPAVNIGTVICNSKLKMPVILVCSFHIVQQMSGISVIWFYSVNIFTDAGFTLSAALWLNFFEGLLNLFVALLGPILMSKFNRRIMMMISCLGSAISLTLLSLGLSAMDVHRAFPISCIFTLSLYIVLFNVGLGPIPYFIGSELFEDGPRPAAMALGSFSNWFSSFFISLVFPILKDNIGAFTFLLCTLFCIYGFLLTCRYLPETRNQNAKDVAPLLEKGFKSKLKKRPSHHN